MGDHEILPPEEGPIVSATPLPVTVEYAARKVVMHSLTGSDLETIASLGNSVHLTFFGVCVGAAITCWVVLKTTNGIDPNTHTEFALGLAVSGLFSVYFGVRAFFDYRTARSKLKEIKDGR